MFCCPICGGPLVWGEQVCRCRKGHCYDIAAQGYVNLLPANRKPSRNPGDNSGMVLGRTHFLDTGSYRPLSDELNKTVSGLCGSSPRILDAGCGEGYYAQRLYGYLAGQGKYPLICGIDLSKPAVKHAARRCREGRFAVASLFDLPIATGTVDLCYNVFSPICAQEFSRVLVSGGWFVAVYPAARHLFGLKEVLYKTPYENEEKTFELEGFEITNRNRICYEFTLEGNALIEALFSMTPYYYKTPIEGSRRLAACEQLRTEADFWIVTYHKETD